MRDEVRRALAEERARYSQQIDVIKRKIAALDILLGDDTPDPPQPSSANGSPGSPSDPEADPAVGTPDNPFPGPTETVKWLFTQNPGRNWTVPHLRDQLNLLVAEGRAVCQNEDRLGAVWTVVRALQKQKFITKTRKGFFRLNAKEGAPA